MKLYITLIHVIIQHEATHKFGELCYLERVKFDRSFLQKTFHKVKQKQTAIIKIILLRQLEKKGGKEKQKSIKSSTEFVRFIWREDTSSEMNRNCKNLEEKSSAILGCLSFHSSHR